MPDEPGAGLLDAREDVPGDDADALLGVGLGQTVAQILVEPAQDLVAAIDDRRLDAEVRENAGELHRDVAAAGDDDALRQARQIERLVRRDDVLEPGIGLAEQGVPPVAMRILPAVSVRPDLASCTALGPVTVARSSISSTPAVPSADAVRGLEPRNLLVLGRDQCRPVEVRLADRPAEAARILEVVGEAAGVDEQLLGHAAADDAGAADAILLRDGDLGAVAGRDARRAHAARAGADHEQIVVELGHACVCRRQSVIRRRRLRRRAG